MRPSLFTILAINAIFAAAPAITRADGTTPSAIQARQGTVNLEYVNGEVADVIRALAAQTKINIAMSPGVKGQVSISLRNKTVQESLSIVTNLAGLAFRKVGDTYIVAPRAEMKALMDQRGVKRNVSVTVITPQKGADMVSAAFDYVTARVQGNSIQLSGAAEDLDEAEALLKQNDVAAPGTIKVTERVPVMYRTAKDVAELLSKMVSNITVQAAGNAVLITGSKGDVATAIAGVAQVDVQGTPDVESRIYRIRYATATALMHMLKESAPDVQVIPGPDSATVLPIKFNPLAATFVGTGGTSGSGGSGGGGGGGGAQGGGAGGADSQGSGGGSGAGQQGGTGTGPGSAIARALSLLLKGTRSALDDAFKTLALVDVAPKQMIIEARVIDASPDFSKNLGVQWSWNPFNFAERPGLSGGTLPGGTGSSGSSNALPLGPLGFGAFGRVQFTPTAILNAMVTSKDSKLLASPQIGVLNDQDASIFIGDTIRFQTLAISGPNTGNQFTVVEVPVGIILLCHPRVNDDGNITLRVHPVVSTITGFTDGLPQTSSREAETVVRVKDGDTIVIGGLIRDEEIKQMSKIPLLGDLPIIGRLFRNDLHTKRRSEVTVFLTIKLIS
jgi:general secretion pathway protein D